MASARMTFENIQQKSEYYYAPECKFWVFDSTKSVMETAKI